MQIASRQGVWNEGGTTTVVTVEMTNETGLCIRFMARSVGAGFFVSWGDGVTEYVPLSSGDTYVEHAYARYGRYRIAFRDVYEIGFRPLDGMAQFAYDAAPLSVVDYAGQLTSVMSGGFKCAVNLQRFIAPNVRGLGQRPFAYCTKLKEVCLGAVTHHFDGSFQGCTALEKYSTVSTGCCWSYVWKGCKRLRELRLGAVSQFATEDFADTPNLMDIWISNKTVAQIRQVAPSGNIAAGYGARFPWGANALCRFHGIDGIVLGNGTVL
jgi:hypothetical protein